MNKPATQAWSAPPPSNPPLVNEAPHEAPEAVEEPKPKEFKLIDNPNYMLASDVIYTYPYNELAIGQGMFIPLEEGDTLEKLSVAIHRQVSQFRKENSQAEVNDDGDEILENVTINAKARNTDGTVKLVDGNPKLIASHIVRPKLIGPNFAVKSVKADDEIGETIKAEIDGVLVIRLD